MSTLILSAPAVHLDAADPMALTYQAEEFKSFAVLECILEH